MLRCPFIHAPEEGSQCLLELRLVSAEKDASSGSPPARAVLAGEGIGRVLGNHGISYCSVSFWGLISGLRVPLPMGDGMQTFMNLPHGLWAGDLQMASGFQWNEGGMGQLKTVSPTIISS